MARIRGGSETARLRGLKPITIHLEPEDHARVAEAARRAGIRIKELVKSIVLREGEKEFREIFRNSS